MDILCISNAYFKPSHGNGRMLVPSAKFKRKCSPAFYGATHQHFIGYKHSLLPLVGYGYKQKMLEKLKGVGVENEVLAVF